MAVAVEGSRRTSSGVANLTTDITVNLPAGVVEGELLLMSISMTESSSSPYPDMTAPSDWNSVLNNTDTWAGSQGMRQRMYWKIAGASEGNPVLTNVNSKVDDVVAEVFRISGAASVSSASTWENYGTNTSLYGGSSLSKTASSPGSVWVQFNSGGAPTIYGPSFDRTSGGWQCPLGEFFLSGQSDHRGATNFYTGKYSPGSVSGFDASYTAGGGGNLMVALAVINPTPDSSPLVGSTSNGETTSSTIHTLNIPSNLTAGAYLFCQIGANSSRNWSTPAGWTSLHAATNTIGMELMYRIIDGTEANVAVSTSSSRTLHYTFWEVENVGSLGTPRTWTTSDSTPTPRESGGAPEYLDGAAPLVLHGVVSNFTDSGSQYPNSLPRDGGFGVVTRRDSSIAVHNTVAGVYLPPHDWSERQSNLNKDSGYSTIGSHPSNAGGDGESAMDWGLRSGNKVGWSLVVYPGGATYSFPTYQGEASRARSGVLTSHTVNMPYYVTSGDLLLMAFMTKKAVTITTPTGWTKVDENTVGDIDLALYYKVADGSEAGGTDTVTTTQSTESASRVLCFSGASGVVETTTPATGYGTTVNPPLLDLSGSEGTQDYTFLTFYASDVKETSSYYDHGSPAGWWTNAVGTDETNNRYERFGKSYIDDGTNRGELAWAIRYSQTDSMDPGTVPIQGNADWIAYTIALHPSAGGGLQPVWGLIPLG